jgi:hypothetical protein
MLTACGSSSSDGNQGGKGGGGSGGSAPAGTGGIAGSDGTHDAGHTDAAIGSDAATTPDATTTPDAATSLDANSRDSLDGGGSGLDGGASDASDVAIADVPVGADAGAGTGGSSNTGGAGQGGVTTGGTTGSGGSPATSGDAGSTVACIGNLTGALSGVTPYWIDKSTTCGSWSVSNGTLELVRQGGCASPPASNQIDALMTLDSSRWSVCGDFDVSVDFSLLAFPVPSNQWHAASLRIADPNGSPVDIFNSSKTPGMTVEVFSSVSTPQVRYNSFTTDAAGNTVYTETSDTQGKFRITRIGAFVSAYYWSSGAWKLLNTATLNRVPWTIELYISGDSATTNDVVDFSGLTIVSSSAP